MIRNVFALLCCVSVLAHASTARAQGGAIGLNCKTSSLMPATLTNEEVPGRPGVRHKSVAPAELQCDDMQLFADRIDDVSDEEVVRATGHVLIVQPGLRISADHAEINRKTKYGVFYDANGTAAISDNPQKSPFGGFEPDVIFRADRLERIGAQTYTYTNAVFTSCMQPTPRWEMSGSRGVVVLDKHIFARNLVLKVKNVPLMYLPAFYYPISHDGRSTGFLMPQYGSDSLRGFKLGNAFFWAIARNQDATFYHDWFKKGAQGFGAKYRIIPAAGSNSDADLTILREKTPLIADVGQTSAQSFTFNGVINQALPHGFRINGNANYFSSATTQQVYQQDATASSQSQRSINVGTSGNVSRVRIGASFQQNDVFSTLSSASRNGYGPRVTLDLPGRQIGRSRVYFRASSQTDYLLRQTDVSDPTTNHSFWRMDASPSVNASLSSLSFLTVQPSASWRITEWFKSQDPATTAPVDTPITRQMLTLSARIGGPSVSRIFQTPNGHYAEKYKHLIEPGLNIQWTSPFENFDRVIQVDGVDNQVGGSGQFTDGVTNTLIAKRKMGASPGSQQSIVIVDVNQTYYTNAKSASYDPQNQTNGTLAQEMAFSPIRVIVRIDPSNTASVDFRTDIDPKFRTPRQDSAGGRINAKQVQLSASWSKQQVIPGLDGFEAVSAYHSLNLSTTIRSASGHVGGSYGFNLDIQHRQWLNQHIVGYYNSQCCGISLDYQTRDISNLGIGRSSNHTLGLSFTLAGLGSFANPFGSFGK